MKKYTFSFIDRQDGAEKELKERGFELIGKAEGNNCYYIISNTFKPLK